MEQEKETSILELVLRPAFLVKDGVVAEIIIENISAVERNAFIFVGYKSPASEFKDFIFPAGSEDLHAYRNFIGKQSYRCTTNSKPQRCLQPHVAVDCGICRHIVV